MKNLKKVLALVVALTMVLGTVTVFAFTDVEAGDDVYTAVQTLSSLEILNGYEDGSFKPENDITRAEFCAVVCRALGLESSAKGAAGATQFTDVPADHWAAGYINLAAGQGIVNGMGDGTFEPESNVTYEQAVKMLVVALGFEPMAQQKGGYPTGYLVVANTYGMTKGVKSAGDSAAANRGVVAQLTYNALDICMMEQTGFGTNTEYTIQDGKNGHDYKTLLSEIDVYKVEGAIVGTPITDPDNCASDEIAVDVEYIDETYVESDGERYFTLADGVDAEPYFGLSVIMYVKEVKNGKYEVISIMPGEDSEIVELDGKDVDSANTNVIKYYASENATKTTDLKLNGNPRVVFNNEAIKFGDFVKEIGNYNFDDAEIKVIENTGDSKYDMIVVKMYSYAVVDEVEAGRDRFTTKDGDTYRFNFDDEDIINSIVNKDGEAISLADINEGDVVAIISEGGAKSNFGWIEVIDLGENYVTGTVNEFYNNGDVAIDSVKYEKFSSLKLNINDEGTFYLTKTNKIFNVEIDSSVSSNYAYILEAGYGSKGAFADGWQLRLITKDGTVGVYDLQDTFKVNGNQYKSSEVDGTFKPFADIKAEGTDFKANADKRIVTYKLNSSNSIKEIKFLESSSITAIDGEYKEDAQSVAKKVLEDDAVIFNLDVNEMEDAKVLGVGQLVDENSYKGWVYRNADGDYDCFVVLEGASAIDYAQDVAIVESLSDITVDDKDCTKVRYYVSNDETVKELVIDEDTAFVDGQEELAKGSAFMFAADAEGVASDVAVLAYVENGKYKLNDNVIKAAVAAEDDNEFVIGYIVDWGTRNNGRYVNYCTGTPSYDEKNKAWLYDETISVKSGANGYTYVKNNASTSRSSIAVGDWQSGDVDKVVDGDEATMFFARSYNGSVKDIITLGDRVIFPK